jgi:hypothetical protein
MTFSTNQFNFLQSNRIGKMNELSISPVFLRRIILETRAIMVKEGLVTPEPGGNPGDDPIPATLQEQPGDLRRQQLLEEIEALDVDQQNQLVALMWIGREDFEPEEWSEAVQMASERREQLTGQYLFDHPLVADYWASGLERLGHGSDVVESGEY